MKCMFNPKIECSVHDVAKELGVVLQPTYVLEKACPICPKRPFPEPPKRLEK